MTSATHEIYYVEYILSCLDMSLSFACTALQLQQLLIMMN